MKTQVKIFIVGGAVRDTLLNRPVKDVDYVVVGATPEWMLAHDFTQVGIDFPVFLDKQGNEFALARTERKTGSGYNGFETDFDPSVTLEEDAVRRDLTVNSLAVRQEDWAEFTNTKNRDLVIDSFNGMQDLDAGVLRHVSPAFAEDPVRVLRVARFAARYDFTIDPSTLDLMAELVKSGELDSLTQERVYAEFEKALMEDSPILFFQVLNEVGAGDVLFPELFDVTRPLMVAESLNRSVLLSGDFLDRVIILSAGLNAEPVVALFKRLKAPTEVIKMVKMSCTLFAGALDHAVEFDTPKDIVKLLNEVNAWNHVEQFQKVMKVFAIFDNNWLRKISYVLLEALKVGNVARFDMLSFEQRETLKGAMIGKAIGKLRFKLIKAIC